MTGVMNLAEAAEFLKIRPEKLAEYARARKVPSTKIGRAWLFSTRLLQGWKPKREPKRIGIRELRRAAEKISAFSVGRKYEDPRGLKRYKRLRLATPAWADRKAIKQIYLSAKALSAETGVEHVVDHVIPIFGALVSGLHVETNLAIITKLENARKGNRWTVE